MDIDKEENLTKNREIEFFPTDGGLALEMIAMAAGPIRERLIQIGTIPYVETATDTDHFLPTEAGLIYENIYHTMKLNEDKRPKNGFRLVFDHTQLEEIECRNPKNVGPYRNSGNIRRRFR